MVINQEKKVIVFGPGYVALGDVFHSSPIGKTK